jgi:endonuclease-3
MNADIAVTVLQRINTIAKRLDDSVATEDTTDGDPFRILVACVLSQRTKEEVTTIAAEKLFAAASTPAEMLHLTEKKIGSLIYPVGFWKTKARAIRGLSAVILERHQGAVPSTMEELLALPGVGRKTANLVLSDAFAIPSICVDTHVHRIMNRLGVVRTPTPESTEMALRAVLPKNVWISVNYALVVFGRNVCTPLSPRCSECEVGGVCERVGVFRSR